VANAFIYVDGFNLYFGALKGTPYKWPDLGALGRQMLPGDRIVGIKYFTARVSARPNDAGQPLRQQIYFRALKTIPDLSIILGHFLTHSVRMPLSSVSPQKKVWVDRTEEKGSDVNLGSHLLMDGVRQRYDLAVVISNDSDLAEPIRMVRRELGLRVGILNPHETHSRVLAPLATFKKRIRQSHLIAAQFPDVMRDATGTFTKPEAW